MRLKINRMFPARHAIRKQRTCSYGMKAEQEPVGEQWSDGRVARQRSAKPCTAVRIRFRPHRNRVAAIYNAVLFLNCHTFVIPTFIRGWFLQYKITSYRYPDEFGGLLDSFYHLILAIVFGLHLV